MRIIRIHALAILIIVGVLGVAPVHGQAVALGIASPEQAREVAPKILDAIFKDIPLNPADEKHARRFYTDVLVRATESKLAPDGATCKKIIERYFLYLASDSVLQSVVPAEKLALFNERMKRRRPIPPGEIKPGCSP